MVEVYLIVLSLHFVPLWLPFLILFDLPLNSFPDFHLQALIGHPLDGLSKHKKFINVVVEVCILLQMMQGEGH